jgi:hypothetical protein
MVQQREERLEPVFMACISAVLGGFFAAAVQTRAGEVAHARSTA